MNIEYVEDKFLYMLTPAAPGQEGQQVERERVGAVPSGRMIPDA